MSTLTLFFALSVTFVVTYAQSTSTLAPPPQPLQTAVVGTFNIIGNSLVSAQQVSYMYSSTIPFDDQSFFLVISWQRTNCLHCRQGREQPHED